MHWLKKGAALIRAKFRTKRWGQVFKHTLKTTGFNDQQVSIEFAL